MANPQSLVNRYRYVVLVVLTAVTLAYGYYLYRSYWPQQESEKAYSVPVTVMADGTLRIEGTTFATPDTLKVKIADIQREHPGAGFSIVAPRNDTMIPIAKAVVLLQKSGAKTIWVLNEPQKTTP